MEELIKQLEDTKSAKRRSAAKNLRKLKDVAAGPALLTALEREVEDPRTWETQYQMVMALGECGYKEALPYLKSLSERPFEATMVYMSLGDAIIRISRSGPNDVSAVFDLIRQGNEMLVNGGLRAVAMLRLIPSSSEIEQIIDFAERYEVNHHLRLWVLAAAPGWEGTRVEKFISSCLSSVRQDISSAAKLAQERKGGCRG